MEQPIAAEPCASYEGLLQAKWNTIPVQYPFHTTAGQELQILARGKWNLEAGPDFQGAKLLLNGKILTGDVEIHVRTSDWKQHRHSEDSAYRNVILHVVETDDGNGPDLPVFVLPKETGLQRCPAGMRNPAGNCTVLFRDMTPEQLLKFFSDAGCERLRKKAKQILPDLIAFGTEYTFLKKYFAALGFRKNQEAFAGLFHETVEKYPREQFRIAFDSILWGESGLLPAERSILPDSEAQQELLRLWTAWWKLRRDAGQKIIWNRSAMRPANVPERRIAALCEFIRIHGTDPLPRWLKLIGESSSPEECAEQIQKEFHCDGGFWRNRTTFRTISRKGASLIGDDRALELTVDVALPCLAALAELQKDSRLSARIPLLLKALPAPESNSVIRRASKQWFANPAERLKILNTAASRQGIHHIDSEFCAKASGDCGVCLLRNSFHPIDGRKEY